MKKLHILTSRKRLLLGSLAGLALLAAASGTIGVNGLRAEAPAAQKPHAEAAYVMVNFADVIESMSMMALSPARWMASITSSLACCSVTGESNWTCMSAPV